MKFALRALEFLIWWLILVYALYLTLFPSASYGAHLKGPVRGLHPVLVRNLKRMGAALHTDFVITPNGGCRRYGSRMAPKSYHRYAAGCKAADIIPINKRVSRYAILRWWRTHVGGGRGFYCGRPFVHVDIGPKRQWRWFCGRRHKKRVAKR